MSAMKRVAVHSAAKRMMSGTARSRPVFKTMLPKGTFDGKIAFVTGGGTGLGKGIATKLSDLGATVAIMSRKRGVVDVAAKEIEEITGNPVIALTGDVRDPEQVKAALDELDERAGIPTIVVNNAAGNFISPFERLNAKGFGTIVDIVLKGTANVTLDAGKRMIQADTGGVFLNITTTYAETGSGYVVPSAAAKAGVSALVKSLGAEWGKYGIRFVGVAPGPIKTKGAFDRLDPTGAFEKLLLENNPSKRFGEVDELANLVTYLTSDYASWMNGEIIHFDGGETVSNAGEFNIFSAVSNDQWDDLENAIRQSNEKSKKDADKALYFEDSHFWSLKGHTQQAPKAGNVDGVHGDGGVQAHADGEPARVRHPGGVAREAQLLGQHHARYPAAPRGALVDRRGRDLAHHPGAAAARDQIREAHRAARRAQGVYTLWRGLANKSKFKENQREIQEVSRLLRESTKSLCRNLKENPNFAENLVKVQQERESLVELMAQTLAELKKHGTFDTLLTYVADDKSTQEKAHEILKKEKEAAEEVTKLTSKLGREKAEHQKEVAEHKTTILQLKEQLLAVKSKTQIDIRYARNEAKAKRSSTSCMYHQLIEEQEDKIEDLQGKCAVEDRVHDETVGFLKDRQDQLQAELVEWTTKHQKDTQAKQQQLQTLQQQKAANAQKLEIFQKRWKDEMAAIQTKEEERKRLLELEALRKEELKAQNTAARIIQVAYSAHLAIKAEKKKATEGEKKGKKGGGKKKGKKW